MLCIASNRTYSGNGPTNGLKYLMQAGVTNVPAGVMKSSGMGFAPKATSASGAVPTRGRC